MHSCLDGHKVALKVPRYQYFNRIFEDLLECLQMEHDRLLHRNPPNNTPRPKPSLQYLLDAPMSNCMNAVLLPEVAQSSSDITNEDKDNNDDSSSDDSSDSSSGDSSDNNELQTLTDDSDDEPEPNDNIQKINLLFSRLEGVNYDTPDEDKM